VDDAAEPAPAVRFLDEEADGALFMNAEDTWGGGGTKALLEGAAAAEGAEAGEEAGEGEDLADALEGMAVEDPEDDEDDLDHWSVMLQVGFALQQSSINFVSAGYFCGRRISGTRAFCGSGFGSTGAGHCVGRRAPAGALSAALELFSSTAFGYLVSTG